MAATSSNIAFHRQQLAVWVADYELDLQLRDPVSEMPSVSPGPEQTAAEPMPAPGQIRLLWPATVSLQEVERPVYVLLMPAASADAMILIPFSRFIVPATPQEWRTGFGKPALAVLCLWNLHVCCRVQLPASWFIKTISSERQVDVARLLEKPNPLETYPSRRFGPPLLHPFDTRHAYLQEETILLDDLCGRGAETGQNVIEYPVSRMEQLRAAETPPAYGAEEKDKESGTEA